VLAYLEELRLENNNEIVILLDAYDSWLQLRPEVLLSRYKAINRRLYATAEKELGSKTINEVGVTQSIIFSAQKVSASPRRRVDYSLVLQAAKMPLLVGLRTLRPLE